MNARKCWNLPTGVSGPSFSLTTISDCPSMRNRGGRFAVTACEKHAAKNHHSNLHCFNRTLGTPRVSERTLALIIMDIVDHLWHISLCCLWVTSIFPRFSVARFHRGNCAGLQAADACATGESVVTSRSWLLERLNCCYVIAGLISGHLQKKQ